MCDCKHKGKADAWEAVFATLQTGNPFFLRSAMRGDSATNLAIAEIKRLYVLEKDVSGLRQQVKAMDRALSEEQANHQTAQLDYNRAMMVLNEALLAANAKVAKLDKIYAVGLETHSDTLHRLQVEREKHTETLKVLEKEREKLDAIHRDRESLKDCKQAKFSSVDWSGSRWEDSLSYFGTVGPKTATEVGEVQESGRRHLRRVLDAKCTYTPGSHPMAVAQAVEFLLKNAKLD